MADTEMYVDILERGKKVARCSLSLEPGAKIVVTGPHAEAIRSELMEGMPFHENGVTKTLVLGRDDVKLMSSLFQIMKGTYGWATMPYFNGEASPASADTIS